MPLSAPRTVVGPIRNPKGSCANVNSWFSARSLGAFDSEATANSTASSRSAASNPASSGVFVCQSWRSGK